MLILAAFAVSLASCHSCACPKKVKKPTHKAHVKKGWGGRYRGAQRVRKPGPRIRVRKDSDRVERMKAYMKKRQESKKK